jgi:hypothetical protein
VLQSPAREISVEWTSEPHRESLLVASLLVGLPEQVADAGFASVIMAESRSD